VELREKDVLCLSDAPSSLHEVLAQHSCDVFFNTAYTFWRTKCFGCPLSYGHTVLSELEGKFITWKTYHSLLCSHQIFQSKPSSALLALSHVTFSCIYLWGSSSDQYCALLHTLLPGTEDSLRSWLEASPKDSATKLCDGQGHAALAQEHGSQVAVWSLG